ncbi:MAG: hypothetical protein NXI04_26950 [Planctomycetaceae bacterium]|nr:hypothetical protein [Planctomycetaceae bacterium]
MTVQSSDAEGVSRVVVLGASNISLGWYPLLHVLQEQIAAPLEIYTAHGMGRSYCGERSRFLSTQLPGILSCGLWGQLPEVPELDPRPCVLITDLGNDLVYGRSPLQVAQAAEQCIQRLRQWNPGCRIVVTRPPVESVDAVGWFRFLLCRLLLFPFCPLTLAQAKAATLELDELLLAMARDLEVEIVRPVPASYGLDPIHVKRNCRRSAFEDMLLPWRQERRADDPVPTIARLRRPRPELRWVRGKQKDTAQPSQTSDNVLVFAF